MKQFFHNPFSIFHHQFLMVNNSFSVLGSPFSVLRSLFFLPRRQAGVIRALFFIFCILSSMLYVLCSSYPALAQNITFQADVNSTTVPLGSYIRLTLTATGVSNLNVISLPDIEGLESDFIGPSSRTSIVNGKRSSSYSLLYNLYPKSIGDFTIPEISVTIDGKVHTTKLIQIHIVDPQADAVLSTEKEMAVAQTLQERLFIVAAVPKNEVYVNEKIPLVIRLYISGISVRNVEMPTFDHVGFLVDDFEEPKQYEQVLNGMRYSIVEFNRAVYPTRSGNVLLGPVKLKCHVLFKNADQSRRRNSFFDDDFFSGFFNSHTVKSVSLKSKPLMFTVKPLPQDGRPKDFSGAVGRFSFNMNATPKKVKVGDPVTVRMKVAGLGSLKTFDLKGFESSQDFKAYDPQVKVEDGAKILEQVLIPQHKNASIIPEVSFSFFDTDQQKYRTISWGPVKLDVAPIDEGQEFRIIGFEGEDGGARIQKDHLGMDIAFIKKRFGKMYSLEYLAYCSFVFIFFAIFIVVGWIFGIIFFKFTYKMKTDAQFARSLKAPRYARNGLKDAKLKMEEGNVREFYDKLFETVQKYFSHKCHIAPGSVTAETVLQILRKKSNVDGIAELIKQVFTQCEAARYASVGFDRQQMKAAYQAAQEVIDWFERKF